MRTVLLIILMVSLGAFNILHSAPKQISEEASQYLDHALSTLESNYYRPKSVDWELLRKRVSWKARKAQTTEDTYPAIEFALEFINDKNAHFIPPKVSDGNAEANDEIPLPSGRILPTGIAYIKLPEALSTERNEMLKYAATGQKLICKLSKEKPLGWVIDLRNNNGGELWPMLLAVGPILGEGKLGSFVYPSGKNLVWRYQSGAVYEEDTVKLKFPEYCRASVRNDKVAVLIDNTTLSAAEGTAIAFIARPKTRLIGANSSGLTTGSQSFVLNDGATLIIPTFTFADRLNHPYGRELKPDEYAKDDDMMWKAKNWINS